MKITPSAPITNASSNINSFVKTDSRVNISQDILTTGLNQRIPFSAAYAGDIVYDIAYEPTIGYVAVGTTNDTVTTPGAFVKISTDGYNWTWLDTPLISSYNTFTVETPAFSNLNTVLIMPNKEIIVGGVGKGRNSRYLAILTNPTELLSAQAKWVFPSNPFTSEIFTFAAGITGTDTQGLSAIIAGCLDGKIGYSFDYGRSWTLVLKANNPFENVTPAAAVRKIVKCNNNTAAFWAVGGTAGTRGIVASTSNPRIWTANTTHPFTSNLLRTVATGTEAIYIAGNNGSFASTSNGATWTKETTTFGTNAIRSMSLFGPKDDRVYLVVNDGTVPVAQTGFKYLYYQKIMCVGDSATVSLRTPNYGTKNFSVPPWQSFSLSGTLIPSYATPSQDQSMWKLNLSASRPSFANNPLHVVTTNTRIVTGIKIVSNPGYTVPGYPYGTIPDDDHNNTLLIAGYPYVVLAPSVLTQITRSATAGAEQITIKTTPATPLLNNNYKNDATITFTPKGVNSFYSIELSGNNNLISQSFSLPNQDVTISNLNGTLEYKATVSTDTGTTLISIPNLLQSPGTTITQPLLANLSNTSTAFLSCAIGPFTYIENYDIDYETNTNPIISSVFIPHLSNPSTYQNALNPKIHYGLNKFFITGLSAGPMLINENRLAKPTEWKYNVKGNSHDLAIYSSDGDIVTVPILKKNTSNLKNVAFNSNVYDYRERFSSFCPLLSVNFVTMSSDGETVVATGRNDKNEHGFCVSTNGGITWQDVISYASLNFNQYTTRPEHLVISGDGLTIVLSFVSTETINSVTSTFASFIVSVDRGQTWINNYQKLKLSSSLGIETLSLSHNGLKWILTEKGVTLGFAVTGMGKAWYSKNKGESFISIPIDNIKAASSISANLYGTISGDGQCIALATSSGRLYYTNNEWLTVTEKAFTLPPFGSLSFVKMDFTGSVIAVNGNYLFQYSNNKGTSWFNVDSETQYFSLHVSGNGQYIIAGGTNKIVIVNSKQNTVVSDSSSQILNLKKSFPQQEYVISNCFIDNNGQKTIVNWSFYGVLGSTNYEYTKEPIPVTTPTLPSHPFRDLKQIWYITIPTMEKIGEKLLKLQGNGANVNSNAVSYNGTYWFSIEKQLADGHSRGVNRSSAAFTDNKLLIVGSSNTYQFTEISNNTHNFELTGIPIADYADYGLSSYTSPTQIGSNINYLGPTNTTKNYFGASIAINKNGGDRVIVGIPNDGRDNRGRAELFVYSNNQWSLSGTTILAGQKPGDYFGTHVSINNSGDTVAIGAPGNFNVLTTNLPYLTAQANNNTLGNISLFGRTYAGFGSTDTRTLAPIRTDVKTNNIRLSDPTRVYPSKGFAQWTAVAMSSSGQFQIAAAEDSIIFTSEDFGKNWNRSHFHGVLHGLNPAGGRWTDVDMTPDGRFRVAVAAWDGTLDNGTLNRYIRNGIYLLDSKPELRDTKTSSVSSKNGWILNSTNDTTLSLAYQISGVYFKLKDDPTDSVSWQSFTGVSISHDGKYITATAMTSARTLAWKQEAETDKTVSGQTTLGTGLDTQWHPGGIWCLSATGQIDPIYGTPVYDVRIVRPEYTSSPNPRPQYFPNTYPVITYFLRWTDVSMSSTGQYQTAIVNGGFIYTSQDYGLTWTKRAVSKSWISVDMSADGSKQVAAVFNEYIYVSTDFGLTWTQRVASGVKKWRGITISYDGEKIIASAEATVTYTGTQSPGSYDQLDYQFAQNAPSGKTFLGQSATLASDGGIFYSYDLGITWQSVSNTSKQMWQKIATSRYGEYFVTGKRVPEIGKMITVAELPAPDFLPYAYGGNNTNVSTFSYTPGLVQCYTLDSNKNWILKGQPLYGKYPCSLFGMSVCLNAQGNLLAIGAPRSPGVANDKYTAGIVEVYGYNSSTNKWVLSGSIIEGETGASLGSDLCFNQTGNVLAIGCLGNTKSTLINGTETHNVPTKSGVLEYYPYSTTSTAPVSSSARVYRWNTTGSIWLQMGSSITRRGIDYFGKSVALDAGGNRLVVGGPGGTLTITSPTTLLSGGVAQVLDWTGTTWTIAREISGNDNIYKSAFLGESVSINSTGNIISIGAPRNVFSSITNQLTGTVWTYNIANNSTLTLSAQKTKDVFGSCVSLDDTGQILAASSLLNDNNNSNIDIDYGNVRVFELPIQAKNKSLWRTIEHISYNVAVNNTSRCVAASPNYFAVGTLGKIIYSQDAINWSSAIVDRNISHVQINNIAYGKNRFCAVGTHGTILVSKTQDPFEWATVLNPPYLASSPNLSSITSVVYDPCSDKFIASGFKDIYVIDPVPLIAKTAQTYGYSTYYALSGKTRGFLSTSRYNFSPDFPTSLVTTGAVTLGLGQQGNITRINGF